MKQIAITGVGIVSPLGHTAKDWFKCLCSSDQRLSPVKAFDPPEGKSRLAIEIKGFDHNMVKAKGSQFFGRTHLLAAVASQSTLSDAGVEPEEISASKIGVVLAMTFGTIESIALFYNRALTHGPAGVSPVDFANTVANSPASRTAILVGARGINATLAHGETAGLDALSYSARHLSSGDEQLILAGSAYGLCLNMYRAFGAQKRLSPIDNQEQERLAPLDTEANGTVLGEGSVVLALECTETAKRRGAHVYGYISGFAQGFYGAQSGKENGAEETVARVIAQAIRNAGLVPEQITWVSAAANAHPQLDALEIGALSRVFGSSMRTKVAAIKSMTGECFDVAGPQSVAAAVLSMAQGIVPPTANLKRPRTELPEECFIFQATPMTISHVLVNTLSFNGGCSALVVSKALEQ